MLGFQAESGPKAVYFCCFRLDCTIEKISRVELNSGLGGQHLQHAAAQWLFDASRQLEPVAGPAQHPIVVIAFAELQLFIVVADARADGRGLAKIERRAVDRAKLARGDKPRIDRRDNDSR